MWFVLTRLFLALKVFSDLLVMRLSFNDDYEWNEKAKLMQPQIMVWNPTPEKMPISADLNRFQSIFFIDSSNNTQF